MTAATTTSDILIRTTRINLDKGWRVYDEREGLEGTIFEGMLVPELASALYSFSIKEYGRCTGKVYVDSEGHTTHIGWCFLKRVQYDDCDETFLCETWVSVEQVIEPAHPAILGPITLGRG